MSKFAFTLIFALIFCTKTFAQTERVSHLLAVGQGIAFPSVTSTINFSDGTTHENPVGTMFQEGFRLTGQIAQGDSTGSAPDTLGAEIGYGGPGWGMAVGSYKLDCEDCEAESSGAVSLEVGNWFAFGLRFAEEVYSLGTVFNSSGNFRVGFVAELNDPEGEDNNITAYGVGIAWVGLEYAIVLDASTWSHESSLIENDVIFVTPGINFHVGMLQISANYRMFVNDENEIYKDNDSLWFGVGVGNAGWHIGVYSDYVRDTAFKASLFF